MDIWVTRNLDQIVRLVETGPKVAQKYITKPITFNKKKIDLRYVVVVKSILPLQVSVHDEFFIRFSNNDFVMDETSFHEYETHFTVMNYGGKNMLNMRCAPFMEAFDKEYESKGIKFSDLTPKIHKAIADVFIAFQTRYGKDIETAGHLEMSRAYYGVDIMVDEDLNARLLEVTFAPDMARFSEFVPEGFNELFNYLFFNEDKNLTQIV
jgi:tubulin--tyrosine ligase-like protein 12